MKEMILAAALFCAAMSFALFVLMGADKRLAQRGARRVPERTLFLLALLFGAPGGLCGMYAFRHKTKHWYFVLGFWGLTLLELFGLGFLVYRFM